MHYMQYILYNQGNFQVRIQILQWKHMISTAINHTIPQLQHIFILHYFILNIPENPSLGFGICFIMYVSYCL